MSVSARFIITQQKFNIDRRIEVSAVAVSKKLLFKFDAEIRAIRKMQDEEKAAIYSASVLYSDYKAEYMASMGALSTKTRNKKEAQIQGVVAFLGSKPIEQIRQADVKQVFADLGGSDDSNITKIKEAGKFLQFCIDSHYVKLDANPFNDFVITNKKVKTKQQSATARLPNFLSKRVETSLFNCVMSDISNGLSMVVPLIIGGELTMDELCELTWGDIEIYGTAVYLRLFNHNKIGAKKRGWIKNEY